MTRLNWRCRACGTVGWDPPGLVSFYQHWSAWHGGPGVWVGGTRSIYGGTR
jgi:hypothetical protein